MSDSSYCNQCAEELFNAGYDHIVPGDFRNLNCYERRNVHCEGCGYDCVVDFSGDCISPICSKHHGARDSKSDDIVMQENSIVQELRMEDDSDVIIPNYDDVNRNDDSVPDQVQDSGRC